MAYIWWKQVTMERVGKSSLHKTKSQREEKLLVAEEQKEDPANDK